MDMLTIMDVPEPPSMGAAGGLLMEQIPEVGRTMLTLVFCDPSHMGHIPNSVVLRAVMCQSVLRHRN